MQPTTEVQKPVTTLEGVLHLQGGGPVNPDKQVEQTVALEQVAHPVIRSLHLLHILTPTSTNPTLQLQSGAARVLNAEASQESQEFALL